MRRILAALFVGGLALAPTASASPYDPSGCIANPLMPCGPNGNPEAPYWQDSPNGPYHDPNCAILDTCVPGEIVP